MLLSIKVRLNVRDIDGRSSLYYVVLYRYVTIVNMLLDLVTTLDETVKEAFLEAAEARHELVV